MAFSPLMRELMEALRVLPGVGQKSAQRMALHLLERNRSGGQRLAQAIEQALDKIGHCQRCRALSEDDICALCLDERRDNSQLCVVQGPQDVFAIEQTGYRGRYFVLRGLLSPLDGLGPDSIGIPQLLERIAVEGFGEVILATSPTVEGEATAHYIAQSLQGGSIVVSRLAHGMPLGGELDTVDGGTLTHALTGRKAMQLS